FVVATHAVLKQPHGGADREARAAFGRTTLGWLDRAEALVPGTKAVSALRNGVLQNSLGDTKAAEAGRRRSATLKVNTPVDHYWHGFAERRRGVIALTSPDPAKAEPASDPPPARKPPDPRAAAQEHFRQAAAEMAAVLQARPEHFWA